MLNKAIIFAPSVTVELSKVAPAAFKGETPPAEEMYRVEELTTTVTTYVRVRAYAVVKKTACGRHLSNGKFVLDKGKKRFAHETLEAAVKAYLARRKRQVALLEYQLAKAKALHSAVLKEVANAQAIRNKKQP